MTDEVEIQILSEAQTSAMLIDFSADDAEKAEAFRIEWEAQEKQFGRFSPEAYDAALAASGISREEATRLLIMHGLYLSQPRN